MTNSPTDLPLILKRPNWPIADQIAWDALFTEGDILDVPALVPTGRKEADESASRLMDTGSVFSAHVNRSACRPT
jgi:hypothetical protein